MNKIEKKLSGLVSGRISGNMLIMRDGRSIDCSGAFHNALCQSVGIDLTQAINAGIARTHWNYMSEIFAVESKKDLTGEQEIVIYKALKKVNAHIVVTDIAGKTDSKVSYNKPIRSI